MDRIPSMRTGFPLSKESMMRFLKYLWPVYLTRTVVLLAVLLAVGMANRKIVTVTYVTTFVCDLRVASRVVNSRLRASMLFRSYYSNVHGHPCCSTLHDYWNTPVALDMSFSTKSPTTSHVTRCDRLESNASIDSLLLVT